MARENVFPNHGLVWYLTRGTLVGGGIGAVLGLLLVLFISGMGDGGSDPSAMMADDVRGVIPYVAGWAIMGFVFGLCWWLLGKIFRRSAS